MSQGGLTTECLGEGLGKGCGQSSVSGGVTRGLLQDRTSSIEGEDSLERKVS